MKKINILTILFIITILLLPEKVLPTNPVAQINLSVNDGVQCYLNRQEFINDLSRAQTEKKWNYTINVSNYIKVGRNVLACRVSNGDGNSGLTNGYFDVELIVGSQTIITSGEGGWKYIGITGQATDTTPAIDSLGRKWYEADYDDSNWQIGNTPFDGKNANISVLKQTPDNAWFRKSFNLDSSLLGLSGSNSSSQNDTPSQTNPSPSPSLPDFDLAGCWPPIVHRFGQ